MMNEANKENNSKIAFNVPADILREIEATKVKLNLSEEAKKLEEDLELSFIALTQGLGFHKEKSEAIPTETVQVKTKTATKTSTLYNQNVSLKRELETNLFDRTDLSPFYNTKGTNHQATHPLFGETQFNSLKTELKKEVIETPKLDVEEVAAASMKDQLFAWGIDLALVTLTLAAFVTAISLLIGIHSVQEWQKLFTMTEGVTYLAPFFVFFYLFYFTILDREGSKTLGKKLMRIRIVAKYEEHMGLTQSFLRAAITLLSALALGLPLLMDFQGKLTDSKVIKEDF